VVLSNLKIAFPNKTEEERIKICHEFYRRFTDNFIETVKLISLSEKEITKRFTCDYETLKLLHSKHYSVNVIMGHCFNWEWANLAYSIGNPFTQLIVYAHVNNKLTERLMLKIRQRFGTKLIDSYKFKEQFKPYVHQQKSFVLVADQNAKNVESAVWTEFFGKRAPFAKTAETGARLTDDAVVFCGIKRVRRGYYVSQLSVFTEHARQTERGEITKASVRFFEKTIREDPPNYLWSHRRWKYNFQEKRDGKHLL
jgi:KDO2-lipid IV(A) lauroyltransferase